LDDFKYGKGQFQLTKHILDKVHLKLTYSLDRIPASYRVKVTAGFKGAFGETRSSNMQDSPVTWTDIVPDWEISPFIDEFVQGKLLSKVTTGGGLENIPGHKPENKFLFIGLHTQLNIPAGKERTFSSMVNIGSDNKPSLFSIKKVISKTNPIKMSSDNWQSFFKQVPYFTCSDKFITKYYWYRWYGLKLNTVDYKSKLLPYPCVFEAPSGSWFRHHIVSTAMFMRDLRWLHNPVLAKGSILNFLANQRGNGSWPIAIPIGTGTLYGEEIAQLNWGDGIKSVFETYNDKEFIKECYEPVGRYVEYVMKTHDKENSGLFDITNMGECGTEYMSRYLFANPKADVTVNDRFRTIQLKAVDATVYTYQLLKTLAWMADLLGKGNDSKKWTKHAERTAEAVRTKMWDDKTKMFYDVHPKTFKRSPYKVSTSFYPFMTDIVGKEHLPAIYKHLLNPKEFWTPFPIPTASIDDPYFSPSAEWKDKMTCAWNGPAWLWTNSTIAEGLCLTALRLDEKLKPYAVEFIKKFIKMLFLDGDINRPTSYEWYNPFTGNPPYFRRVDDYMHCWIIDLIIKYVAGLHVEDDKLVVDPFDFGLNYFLLDNVLCQGHRLKIEWKKPILSIWIDGKLKGKRKGLGKFEI